jgi:hypothetical protein
MGIMIRYINLKYEVDSQRNKEVTVTDSIFKDKSKFKG